MKRKIFEILSKNKNGAYAKEKVFANMFEAAYNDINKHVFPDEFSFKQKLYHWLNDDFNFVLGICYCGKRCKFISINQGYRKYCSLKCAANADDVKNYKKNTYIRHYGVEHPLKSEQVKEKIKETNLERYGVENVFASDEIKEKTKETNLKKYGVKNIMQCETVKEKVKQTNLEKYGVECSLQSNKIKEKTKKTNLKKYGVDVASKSKQVKEKIKETNLERYGVENVFASDEIKEKIKETNIKKYGVNYSSQADITKEHIKQTCLEKYGVEWFCMTKDCRSNSSNDSKPNRKFAELLDKNDITYEREFTLEQYSYDFKIGDFLIEINPVITHNSFLSIFNREPLKPDYHLNKSNCAKEHGFQCIHVWDWDNVSKIMNMLKPKEILYARNLELKEVSEKECNEFLNAFHLQNTCAGQTIRIGLYKDDVLVQVMTFGKPRYNKNYKLELLRLCSHKDYKIVGGANKLFRYVINTYNIISVISYCDNSKFTGEVYERLGFKKYKSPKPSKHWYNMKTKQHITDNLLRQRGFDQLFDTNYGKGALNEELMLEHNFLPIYDCGQTVFIFNK